MLSRKCEPQTQQTLVAKATNDLMTIPLRFKSDQWISAYSAFSIQKSNSQSRSFDFLQVSKSKYNNCMAVCMYIGIGTKSKSVATTNIYPNY